MKISAVNNINGKIFDVAQKVNANKVSLSNDKDFAVPSSENIKAIFMPTFKGGVPIKKVVVYERETNQPRRAVVFKNDIGEFSSFELNIDGEKGCAGFMHFKNEKDFCEIRHLRTLDAGKKYSGIGTALVGCAIDESFLLGKKGSVFAMSQKGYGKDFSDYNKGTNPLPFYLKRGFVVSDIKVDENLNFNYSENSMNGSLDKIMVVLTPEAAIDFREKYDKDSVYL